MEEVAAFTYPHGLDTTTHKVPVERDNRYVFEIRDAAADGLCCGNPGNFTVFYQNVTLVYGEGNYGESSTQEFTIW